MGGPSWEKLWGAGIKFYKDKNFQAAYAILSECLEQLKQKYPHKWKDIFDCYHIMLNALVMLGNQCSRKSMEIGEEGMQYVNSGTLTEQADYYDSMATAYAHNVTYELNAKVDHKGKDGETQKIGLRELIILEAIDINNTLQQPDKANEYWFKAKALGHFDENEDSYYGKVIGMLYAKAELLVMQMRLTQEGWLIEGQIQAKASTLERPDEIDRIQDKIRQQANKIPSFLAENNVSTPKVIAKACNLQGFIFRKLGTTADITAARVAYEKAADLEPANGEYDENLRELISNNQSWMKERFEAACQGWEYDVEVVDEMWNRANSLVDFRFPYSLALMLREKHAGNANRVAEVDKSIARGLEIAARQFMMDAHSVAAFKSVLRAAVYNKVISQYQSDFLDSIAEDTKTFSDIRFKRLQYQVELLGGAIHSLNQRVETNKANIDRLHADIKNLKDALRRKDKRALKFGVAKIALGFLGTGVIDALQSCADLADVIQVGSSLLHIPADQLEQLVGRGLEHLKDHVGDLAKEHMRRTSLDPDAVIEDWYNAAVELRGSVQTQGVTGGIAALDIAGGGGAPAVPARHIPESGGVVVSGNTPHHTTQRVTGIVPAARQGNGTVDDGGDTDTEDEQFLHQVTAEFFAQNPAYRRPEPVWFKGTTGKHGVRFLNGELRRPAIVREFCQYLDRQGFHTETQKDKRSTTILTLATKS